MQQNLLKPHEVKPEFWRQFFPKFEESRKNFAKNVLSHEQYPEFMGHIAELAEKAGLKYVPNVLIGEIGMGGGIVYTANAMGVPNERGIIINPKMMKATNASLNSRLTPELEAVVAHELGHLKDGFLHMWTLQRGALYATPIVAMAGLYLYDKAHEKTPHLENQSKDEHFKVLEQNLHKAADEEIEKIKNEKKEGWQLDPKWQEGIMNAGRYSMAAAIGLVASLGITRCGMNAAEFRSDRMMVKLTQNPEPFKKIMTQMEDEGNQFLKYYEQRINQLKKEGFTMTFKNKIQNLYLTEIVGAHPSNVDRFKAINNFAERLQRSNGFAEGRA